MTGLDLLKTHLSELSLLPRTLAPVEIVDLLESALEGDWAPRAVINFPMPVPKWDTTPLRPSHVVRAWAWESEQHLSLLAELPDAFQGMTESSLGQLNRRAEMVGRFFDGSDGKTYYLNPQAIICKDGISNGRPINLHQVKAAREAAKGLVFLSLAGAVRDLALSLHLVTAYPNGSPL